MGQGMWNGMWDSALDMLNQLRRAPCMHITTHAWSLYMRRRLEDAAAALRDDLHERERQVAELHIAQQVRGSLWWPIIWKGTAGFMECACDTVRGASTPVLSNMLPFVFAGASGSLG